MREAEPIAYGLLMLKPKEFYELTIGEFESMVNGYELRRKTMIETQCVFTANIMNVHLGRKYQITPMELFRIFYPKTKIDRQNDREEFIKGLTEEQRKKVKRYGNNS